MADALRAASPTLDVPPEQYRKICMDAIAGTLARAELKGKPVGKPVGIAPSSLVTQLVVGPEVPTWIFELVKSLLLRYGFATPISWSSLKGVD